MLLISHPWLLLMLQSSPVILLVLLLLPAGTLLQLMICHTMCYTMCYNTIIEQACHRRYQSADPEDPWLQLECGQIAAHVITHDITGLIHVVFYPFSP
jgi:hypothetical protein